MFAAICDVKQRTTAKHCKKVGTLRLGPMPFFFTGVSCSSLGVSISFFHVLKNCLGSTGDADAVGGKRLLLLSAKHGRLVRHCGCGS